MDRHTAAHLRIMPLLRELASAPVLDLRVKHALIDLDSRAAAASPDAYPQAAARTLSAPPVSVNEFAPEAGGVDCEVTNG